MLAVVSMSAVPLAPIPEDASKVTDEAITFTDESSPVVESSIVPAEVRITFAVPSVPETSMDATVIFPLVVSKFKPPFSKSAVTVPPWY